MSAPPRRRRRAPRPARRWACRDAAAAVAHAHDLRPAPFRNGPVAAGPRSSCKPEPSRESSCPRAGPARTPISPRATTAPAFPPTAPFHPRTCDVLRCVAHGPALVPRRPTPRRCRRAYPDGGLRRVFLAACERPSRVPARPRTRHVAYFHSRHALMEAWRTASALSIVLRRLARVQLPNALGTCTVRRRFRTAIRAPVAIAVAPLFPVTLRARSAARRQVSAARDGLFVMLFFWRGFLALLLFWRFCMCRA